MRQYSLYAHSRHIRLYGICTKTINCPYFQQPVLVFRNVTQTSEPWRASVYCGCELDTWCATWTNIAHRELFSEIIGSEIANTTKQHSAELTSIWNLQSNLNLKILFFLSYNLYRVSTCQFNRAGKQTMGGPLILLAAYMYFPRCQTSTRWTQEVPSSGQQK